MSSVGKVAGPAFKDQFRHANRPAIKNNVQSPTRSSVPLAEARLVSDSVVERERRQMELDERMRMVERRELQQQRPRSLSLIFTKKQWLVVGFLIVIFAATTVAIVFATNKGSVSSPVEASATSRPKNLEEGPLPTSPPLPVAPMAQPSPAPTFAQRTKEDVAAIFNFIRSITLSSRPLSYPSQEATPQERALQWLIEEDVSTEVSDLLSLRQRFVLATLWFANGPFDTETWLSPMNVCEWEGVLGCVNREVTWLMLSFYGLSGTIPPDLGLLTALRNLGLQSNRLTGSIPDEVVQLRALTSVNLDRNRLTGTIPEELNELTALTSLNLWENQLNGTIPSVLSELTSLATLGVSSNRLTGPIPTEIGGLTDLTSLRLSGNDLTGLIPSEVGEMTALRHLSFGGNQLNGTIPHEVGNLTDLVGLFLESNQLTGSIPSQIASLTWLEKFFAFSNNLTGSIPSEVVSLTSLNAFFVDDNDLTGRIPFCDLNLNSSEIIVINVDCAEVDCPCCSAC